MTLRIWAAAAGLFALAFAFHPGQARAHGRTDSEFNMLGKWTLVLNDQLKRTFQGPLIVDKSLGGGEFRGNLVVSWSHGAGGTVRQDVVVKVQGKTVTVDCNNPVILKGKGKGTYYADYFTLKIENRNLLVGGNKHDGGITGSTRVSRVE